MKKAIGQTVRDLKRGVNKKVLKVPSIEQKVLDATSNEPWGPHGSILADIAQATRNYHEYQMIMSVIWKRVNDTGKNWRHVYKALTVLEYLVSHGSERVIDDIREHSYQISTLSDFQYIDSSGKDQGNNVRKKSQSLVVLVNDKERIQEARQKAAANREKYRNTPTGSMYRPGSGSYGDRYDDDRTEGRYGYGSRNDDRNGYGREREWGSRDDDRYGQYGESRGHEGDRYDRDEDRYGRDGSTDDAYRGRNQSSDDYNYGSRSKSADRYRSSSNEDDGQYSSRGSGAKDSDQYQDGRVDRKNSEQDSGAPPSYEDVGAARSPHSERGGDSPQAFGPKASSPAGASPSHVTTTASPPPALSSSSSASVVPQINNEVDGFDEFDPRGSFSASPAASNGIAPAASAVEMDLLGSFSDSFSSNSLALVPAGQPDVAPEANTSASFNSAPPTADASVAMNNNQPFDDPFGDGPFRAIPTTDSALVEQQFSTSTNSFITNSSQNVVLPPPPPQNAATEFRGPFGETTYMPSSPPAVTTSTQFAQQELSPTYQDIDILADILPPSAPSSFTNPQGGHPVAPSQPASHGGVPPQTNQQELQTGLSSLGGPNAPQISYREQTVQPMGFPTQLGQPLMQGSYPLQSAGPVSQMGFPTQTMASTFPVQGDQASQMGFESQVGSAQPNPLNSNFYGTYHSQPAGPASAYMVPPGSTGATMQHSFLPNSGPSVPVASQMGHQSPQVQSNSLTNTVPVTSQASTGSSGIVPKSSSDKFETKSAVWADTLSRGLVNLNISGSKTNPLNDIGVDFDAINRKEKRMEKPMTTTVTSTINMGKAMGSGSGIGRAGATALRPTPNPMMGSGMNFGMAGGPGGGMGMGGYGGSQQVGRGMGMGVNMPGAMGMGQGMNMGMGPGLNMQQPMGLPPGSTMPGGYNPTMGTGNYVQQPYGGGYR